MKKAIEIISAFITILFCAIHSAGQIPMETKTIQSPNVATLGRYGDVPVSLFTGVPAISIPIYDVVSGDNIIPIALSYHSAGVMPEQHPGWVGLGWSLMCGGCVSRIVNDLPDEYTNDLFGNYGYYFNYDCLSGGGWFDLNNLLNDWEKDTQPDEFRFNVNGYNGEFYINQNGTVNVKCDKKVKVEIKMNGMKVPSSLTYAANIWDNTKPFSGFLITTEDGIQYEFGMKENAIEYSINFWNQDNYNWIATLWHLTSITYTDGRTVDFDYYRSDYACQLGFSVSSFSYAVEAGSGMISSSCFKNTTGDPDSLSISGNLISPVYLEKIKFDGGYIDFISEQTSELRYDEKKISDMYYHNPLTNDLGALVNKESVSKGFPECLTYLQWRKLVAMNVFDMYGNPVRQFKFKYVDNPSSRLMLTEFSEDSENSSNRTYRFVYNNPDSLPPYLSRMVDHWGYYNGKFANTHSAQYFNNRESDPWKMKYGVLEKIIYPTGGYTRFEFEANTCGKFLSFHRMSVSNFGENKIVGGLRIKRILSSPTGLLDDETVEKEFFYVSGFKGNLTSENNVSSGVLGCYPQYNFKIPKYALFPSSSVDISVFSSQPVLSGGNNALGSHVGYTEVAEVNNNGSFTVYKFSNFDTGAIDDPCDLILSEFDSPFSPYSSKEQDRGLLLSSETYDSNGMLVNRKTYEYEKDDETIDNHVRSAKIAVYGSCGGSVSYAEAMSYRIYTYLRRKVRETEEIYEQGAAVPATIVTTYSYNDNKLLSETTFDYGNGLFIKRYRYPADFQSNGTYSAMVDKHILSPIVEYKEINKTGGTEYQQKYDRYDYSLSNGYYLPYKFSSSVNGVPEEREAYTYNKYGKILTITKDKADTTVYLWGYGGRYVVAEIRGLSISEIESVTGDIDEFCEKESPEFVRLDQLRMKYPYAHIKTCKYEVLVGPEAISDQRGVSEYYMYDDSGRLRRVKDNNGKFKALYEYNFKPYTP